MSPILLGTHLHGTLIVQAVGKNSTLLIKTETETHKRSNPAGIKAKIERHFGAVYKSPNSHVRLKLNFLLFIEVLQLWASLPQIKHINQSVNHQQLFLYTLIIYYLSSSYLTVNCL